ncbi:MAG TPA: hypothetical protein DCL60_09110 [Armatimonadetes bacterium]|nr:hypothetical protein [Armatimonadota bacterium]
MSLKKSAILTVLILCCLSLLTAAGAQVAAPAPTVIYAGGAQLPEGVKLSGWGMGTAKLSNQAIEINSKELYTGGCLSFAKPADLTAAFNTPHTYLQIMVRLLGMQAAAQSRDDEWAAALLAPDPGQIKKDAQPGKTVGRLQVMAFLEDGTGMELQVDTGGFSPADNGCLPVSFPLTLLKGALEAKEYKLARLVICGNGTDPFTVTQIKLVQDSAPLEPTAGANREVARNDKALFTGKCKSGTSSILYSWDFDDSDGIGEDSAESTVYHQFTKPGTYNVTLTCTDFFGIKKPAKSVIKVQVNE